MADIILTNATVLTMDRDNTVYEDGYIVISGDTITDIGHMAALYAAGSADKRRGYDRIDCRGGIITPGMVNTHSHIPMMVFRSLADDVHDRLKRYLFPLEKNTMTADMARAGAVYAFAELIAGGVTTVYDAYYFENEIAEAAAACGIRGVLSETVLNFPSPNAVLPYGGIPYTRDFIKRWRGHKLVTPAVNCHAPYTNDAEHLKECRRIAWDNDVIMCMHVAEMDYEQRDCLRDFGMTPVKYLDSLGLLDETFLAAHAINLDERDIEIFAARGAAVSYNAGSNAKGAKGVAPVYKLRQHGVTVGLGSDGPMSGNTIDIITQLSLVGKIQKLFNNDRTLFPAKEILRMATIDGAAALGLKEATGSLEKGKKADIIVLETDSINMQPVYDPYSTVVYSANPSNVRHSIINGEIVMLDRKLLTIDIAAARNDMLAYRDIIASVAKKIDDGHFV